MTFPPGFLWGASTSAHQVEGNNTNSDIWALENQADSPMRERSGDGCDSLHRWPEDLDLVAALGLNAYRFSVEWARVEPAPGQVSRAMLAHYRRVIVGCMERGITPVVTLHHFSSPLWFRAAGGWEATDSTAAFARYVRAVLPILDGVRWACTINEPNMVAIISTALKAGTGAAGLTSLPLPDATVTRALTDAHHAARAELAGVTGLKSGWTVANQNVQSVEGAQAEADEWRETREDQFLRTAADDDFIGVQAYTRNVIGPEGVRAPDPGARRTITGWEFYPHALADAVRHTSAVLPDVPILVTENGIATAADGERIEYTEAALRGLHAAMADGVDVRGYLHWSLLDNYEWGSYAPTFGLVSVDRETFARTPKPSAGWLGEVARRNEI